MILFLIAYILVFPLTLVNFLCVKDKKGYFRSTSVTLDKFGNMEFRTLFNKVLIKNNGYQFGNELETISSVLGKNEQAGTLSKTGLALAWVLNHIQKNHCINSIINF